MPCKLRFRLVHVGRKLLFSLTNFNYLYDTTFKLHCTAYSISLIYIRNWQSVLIYSQFCRVADSKVADEHGSPFCKQFCLIYNYYSRPHYFEQLIIAGSC